jgi:sulfur-oxidizing protein SoxZ
MSFSHTLRRSRRTLLRQLGATGVLVTLGPAGAWATKEMETGHRRDVYGKLIPRQIIHTFTCTYNGTEVFRADWHPAVAANPYLAFFTVATESGRLRFEWIDDEGTVYATEAEITVA